MSNGKKYNSGKGSGEQTNSPQPIHIKSTLNGHKTETQTINLLPREAGIGFSPLTIPLHKGATALQFVSRDETWKFNQRQHAYTLGKGNLSYQIEDVQDNLFLAFYRLAPERPGSKAYEEHKYQYLRAIVRRWSNDIAQDTEWNNACKAVYERQVSLVRSLQTIGWTSEEVQLVTDSRMIAGLGYDGPLEVGITLHPLYGFPYLPGSSVKGIVRAYAEQVLKPQGIVSEDELKHLFGSPNKSNEEPDLNQLGVVRFFDAIPSAFPKLAVDVMTPHFGDYYMSPIPGPPGDWSNPSPVPFLTVIEGQSFSFFLAANDSDEKLLNKLIEWLVSGLSYVGAGGKTAAGYGFFETNDKRKATATHLANLVKQYRVSQIDDESYPTFHIDPIPEPVVPPLGPVPHGFNAGTVVVIKAKNMRGKISPDEGGESIPFRVEDAEGVGSGDAVSYKKVSKNGEYWAIEVRKR